MSSHAPASRPLHDRSSQPSPPVFLQSRETGDVLPNSNPDATAITQRGWAHFVAGACGGMTAAFLTNPLDVLKTRLQSDFYQSQLASARAARGIPSISSLSFSRSAALHIRETFQILFAVPRVEGWRALFKGLGPNLVGVVPARAINFYAYGNAKKLIARRFNDGKEASWVHLCAAANAGIITGTATCPIWVVKTRLQLDKSQAEKAGAQQMRRYRNAFDCTMQTLRQEGIRGLYRGLGASYLGVTESTLQWVLYEQMKLRLASREERVKKSGTAPSALDQALVWTGKAGAAGTAKLFAAVVTYPHEVVRTRLRQAPMANGQIKYTGIIQCVRVVLAEEGIVGLYGGLIPHVLRVVPSAGIMFGCYEAILHLLGADSGV